MFLKTSVTIDFTSNAWALEGVFDLKENFGLLSCALALGLGVLELCKFWKGGVRSLGFDSLSLWSGLMDLLFLGIEPFFSMFSCGGGLFWCGVIFGFGLGVVHQSRKILNEGVWPLEGALRSADFLTLGSLANFRRSMGSEFLLLCFVFRIPSVIFWVPANFISLSFRRNL